MGLVAIRDKGEKEGSRQPAREEKPRQLAEGNALLGSLVVFATSMTLCNAGCYFLLPKAFPGVPDQGCKDSDGLIHPMGSEWVTGNCEKCSCLKRGLFCCFIADVPVKYDRAKCKEIFHHETCKYTVVEKENPEKTCVVHEWAG
ncbi:beta-microseminoprotein [Nycticebus coucang]|uniref:beta-microseminoprotein n=1 Tax=Nycticebus coucang TaxID=9470 RepID=UPI00234D6A8B|nr:beta-microseminoprotein [Nycticebus coucang]